MQRDTRLREGSDTPKPNGQLTLPFLTADQAATIDAAREAVDRATGNAVAARRPVEAAELARLGARLSEILEANATGVRATQ